MVIAAEQHATRLVVPSSQRVPANRWSSHKDIAGKALKKLAGPHVPALTKLELAVKCAHAAYDKAEALVREQQRAERRPAEPDTRTTASATSSMRTSTTPRSPDAARRRDDSPPDGGTP